MATHAIDGNHYQYVPVRPGRHTMRELAVISKSTIEYAKETIDITMYMCKNIRKKHKQLEDSIECKCAAGFEGLSDYQQSALNTSIAIESDVVTVIVGEGEDQQKFIVHETLLAINSGFFKGCFNRESGWIEGNERKVSLPEVDSQVFSVFVRYLYSGQCIVKKHDKLLYKKNADGTLRQRFLPAELMFHCYILADHILASPFKNALMLAIIDRLNYKADGYGKAFVKSASLLWEFLPPSSPLRLLYLDIWTWEGDEVWYNKDVMDEDTDIHTACFEFWHDLGAHQARFRNLVRSCGTAAVADVDARPWATEKERYIQGPTRVDAEKPHLNEDLAELYLSSEPPED